ncbi:hypothetical protein Dsin_006076 [Dipteronia sinensis]|uniref:F-box domain-containing protein n=1 Tax=Dipteronia sinensis TaxID=43782 RepID=A0AAE0AZ02_9ROSI|nr:hypothetical protein Dsin_006076 [Dipteronia sinensis]
MGKTRTQRQNLLKKKGKQEENHNQLANLPEHIVMKIIEKVPSRYLHDTFRHVSKSWHDLISSPEFAVKNTIEAKSELLLQVPKTWRFRWVYKLQSLEMMDDQNQKAALEIKSRNIYPHIRMIRSSCNGLVLVLDYKYNQREIEGALMQVKNLLTKCCLTLPKCPSNCIHENEVCGVALGFDPSTNEYKVVHICGDGYRFEIFTLGCYDNAWRTVPGPFLVETFEWRDPVLVNGRVMHWYVNSNEYVLSMNICDENAYKT